MARVRLDRDFGDLRELIPTGKALMRELGDLAVRRIRTRTEKGLDVNGRAFQPLSAGYARQKQKALGHARADLTVSGRMLNDMRVVAVTERTAEISFTSQGGRAAPGLTFIQRSRSVGAADKAFHHEEGNHGVIRHFFGLSEDDEEALLEAIGEAFDRKADAR